MSPIAPLPEPLRGLEPGTWAHYTVSERLPGIARLVLAENHLLPVQADALTALIESLPGGDIRPLDDSDAPDRPIWARFVQPYLHDTWLSAPWFFVEMLFFRHILAATGYYRPGVGFGADPYHVQKAAGLATAEEQARLIAAATRESPNPDTVRELLIYQLWGNQGDLSIWPIRPNMKSSSPDATHLIVDDTAVVAERLANGELRRVDIVLDNAGLEACSDLLAAAYFLRSGVKRIVLHVRPYPMYVSDVTAPDLTTTLAFLEYSSDSGVREAATLVRAGMVSGQVLVRTDLFWASPLPFWAMPVQLRGAMAASDLIILKGDMNYRRLLGDLQWAPTTPLRTIAAGAPAPILALRVCKAELAAGLEEAQVAAATLADPDWLVDGRWGMAQYVDPSFADGESAG